MGWWASPTFLHLLRTVRSSTPRSSAISSKVTFSLLRFCQRIHFLTLMMDHSNIMIYQLRSNHFHQNLLLGIMKNQKSYRVNQFVIRKRFWSTHFWSSAGSFIRYVFYAAMGYVTYLTDPTIVVPTFYFEHSHDKFNFSFRLCSK